MTDNTMLFHGCVLGEEINTHIPVRYCDMELFKYLFFSQSIATS
jgi:hypothetical protein